MSVSQANVIILLTLDPRVTIAAIEAGMGQSVREEVRNTANATSTRYHVTHGVLFSLGGLLGCTILTDHLT